MAGTHFFPSEITQYQGIVAEICRMMQAHQQATSASKEILEKLTAEFTALHEELNHNPSKKAWFAQYAQLWESVFFNSLYYPYAQTIKAKFLEIWGAMDYADRLLCSQLNGNLYRVINANAFAENQFEQLIIRDWSQHTKAIALGEDIDHGVSTSSKPFELSPGVKVFTLNLTDKDGNSLRIATWLRPAFIHIEVKNEKFNSHHPERFLDVLLKLLLG